MSRMADLDLELREWLLGRVSGVSADRMLELSDNLVAALIPDNESFERLFGKPTRLDSPPFPPQLCQECGAFLPTAMRRPAVRENFCQECE